MTRAQVGLAGLAAVIAAVWGLCYVLIQSALPSPAPLLLAAARALIGGALLTAVALWRAPASLRPGVPGALPPPGVLLALSSANVALAFGAMYLAAGRAEAGVAAILTGGQPVLLAAAGWLWLGERASRRTSLGLGLALAGLALTATAASGATTGAGLALAALAAAAPAAGTLLMRRLREEIDVLATTGAQFLLGAAILLIASAVVEPWSGVSWAAAMPGLLVLGVLGTAVAYLGWFWLLGRLSLVLLGAALFLVPLTGAVLAIALGERPAPVELAGMALLVIAVGLVATDAGRE